MRMAFSVYSSRNPSMNYLVIARLVALTAAETNKPNIIVTLTD